MIRNPYRNYVCNVNLMCIFLMSQKTISNRIRSYIPNTKLLHNKPKKDWNKHNIHVLIVSRKMIINDNNKRNYSRYKSEPRFHSHFWVVLIFLFFLNSFLLFFVFDFRLPYFFPLNRILYNWPVYRLPKQFSFRFNMFTCMPYFRILFFSSFLRTMDIK